MRWFVGESVSKLQSGGKTQACDIIASSLAAPHSYVPQDASALTRVPSACTCSRVAQTCPWPSSQTSTREGSCGAPVLSTKSEVSLAFRCTTIHAAVLTQSKLRAPARSHARTDRRRALSNRHPGTTCNTPFCVICSVGCVPACVSAHTAPQRVCTAASSSVRASHCTCASGGPKDRRERSRAMVLPSAFEFVQCFGCENCARSSNTYSDEASAEVGASQKRAPLSTKTLGSPPPSTDSVYLARLSRLCARTQPCEFHTV
jgi:hypothetical protein